MYYTNNINSVFLIAFNKYIVFIKLMVILVFYHTLLYIIENFMIIATKKQIWGWGTSLKCP